MSGEVEIKLALKGAEQQKDRGKLDAVLVGVFFHFLPNLFTLQSALSYEALSYNNYQLSGVQAIT